MFVEESAEGAERAFRRLEGFVKTDGSALCDAFEEKVVDAVSERGEDALVPGQVAA